MLWKECWTWREWEKLRVPVVDKANGVLNQFDGVLEGLPAQISRCGHGVSEDDAISHVTNWKRRGELLASIHSKIQSSLLLRFHFQCHRPCFPDKPGEDLHKQCGHLTSPGMYYNPPPDNTSSPRQSCKGMTPRRTHCMTRTWQLVPSHEWHGAEMNSHSSNEQFNDIACHQGKL